MPNPRESSALKLTSGDIGIDPTAPGTNHSPRHRHRNKPQSHQSNRNAYIPITHMYLQTSFGNYPQTMLHWPLYSSGLGISSMVWQYYYCVHYQTQEGAIDGGRTVYYTLGVGGISDPLLLWPAFAH